MNSKTKLIVEEYHHNNYSFEVECMEGTEPVDRLVTEDDLYKWLEDVSYCTRSYTDQFGERVEVPTNVYDFIEEADMYKVLADYLNDTEQRTLPVSMRNKPLPDLSDIGATITHLTSTIPNVKTANAA